MPARSLNRTAAALLGLQFICMWGAFFVLSGAINWPASLDLPPAEILPLILGKSGPVFTGYLSYLIHAILLIPLAVILRHTLNMTPVMGGLTVSLGALAGLAKALGIVRCLFLMPGLAVAYTDPAATDATKAAIEVVQSAFNAYAGGVGELLGVGLFTGTWTILVSAALVRFGGGARLLGYAGFLGAALLLLTLLSLVGFESPVLLTLSGIYWQIWAAAVAIWHLRR